MRVFGALLVTSLVLSNYIGTIDMNNKYRYSLDLDTYVDRDTETDNEGVTSAIMGKKTNAVAPEESDYSRFRKDFATKIKNAYSDYEEFAKLFATNYVPVDRDEVNSHVDKLMPTKDEVSSVGHTPEELSDIKTQVESAIELDEESTGIMTKPKPRPFKENASAVRSVRNNNPGNIDRDGTDWDGMSSDQTTDSRFVVFDTPEMGVRAMGKVLKTYKTTHKLDTISGILNRWSPPTENDTASYINNVSKDLGIDANQKIDVVKDKDTMKNLIKAIIKTEGGKEATEFYTSDIVDRGVDLIEDN